MFRFWHPNPGHRIVGIANYFSNTFDLCTAIVISDSSDKKISEAATSLMSFFQPRIFANCYLNSSGASLPKITAATSIKVATTSAKNKHPVGRSRKMQPTEGPRLKNARVSVVAKSRSPTSRIVREKYFLGIPRIIPAKNKLPRIVRVNMVLYLEPYCLPIARWLLCFD